MKEYIENSPHTICTTYHEGYKIIARDYWVRDRESPKADQGRIIGSYSDCLIYKEGKLILSTTKSIDGAKLIANNKSIFDAKNRVTQIENIFFANRGFC